MISLKQSAGLTAASLALGLAACGGGSSGGSPSAPIAVSMSVPPPATLSIGTTATMTATVSNDPALAGVKWVVSCSAADCGSFNPTQTSSGVAAIYTPPSTLPSPATVTDTYNGNPLVMGGILAFNGTALAAGNNGVPQPAVALTGSQNTASGTLQLTGLSGDTITGSGWGYYPIDTSRTLAIEVDGQQLGLLLLEHQSP